ncbi:MAG: NAD(+) synthase [Planctomycetaceae bacterium]|nr:NAD(+) synthase [Planctomycetaceae bacterium]
MSHLEQVSFSASSLDIDPRREADRIAAALREQVVRRLRRKGLVVGLSGGIDSSVCAGLCVRALGADRVFGIMMPERDSDPESLQLGREVAEQFGIPSVVEDIAPTLEGTGCYRRRDEAFRSVFPEYGPGCRAKIVLPSLFGESVYRVFSAVMETPDGTQQRARLPLDAYQTIVAATNFKQRVRKMIEYFHADRLRYAVVGTPNRLEYDLGFFVKNGDGSADVKPIAHLYKSQVYQLAEFLGVPESVRLRPPTTDTYSLAQSQEEFFFSLPYHQMDLCLFAKDQDVPPQEVAEAAGLTPEQVERVYDDIDAKRKAAEYLHEVPLVVSGH